MGSDAPVLSLGTVVAAPPELPDTFWGVGRCEGQRRGPRDPEADLVLLLLLQPKALPPGRQNLRAQRASATSAPASPPRQRVGAQPAQPQASASRQPLRPATPRCPAGGAGDWSGPTHCTAHPCARPRSGPPRRPRRGPSRGPQQGRQPPDWQCPGLCRRDTEAGQAAGGGPGPRPSRREPVRACGAGGDRTAFTSICSCGNLCLFFNWFLGRTLRCSGATPGSGLRNLSWWCSGTTCSEDGT